MYSLASKYVRNTHYVLIKVFHIQICFECKTPLYKEIVFFAADYVKIIELHIVDT